VLILDELSYTETMLKNRTFGKRYIKLKDLVLLSKYYYYSGLDTRNIKKKLKTLCKKVDPSWNETTQGWKIVIAIKEAKKRRIRTSIPIPVTKAELEEIKKVNDYSMEKVLFAMLVYAKVLKYNNTTLRPRKKLRLLGTFYVNETLSNIFTVARVESSKKQRTDMIHHLYSLGYLDATRYGGFLLKYVQEESPVELMVETYDNLILYYQRYCGEQIAACAECGKLFVKKYSTDSLCHLCKQEKRKEQWRKNSKKYYLTSSFSSKNIS
jgi:hypothetical protein